MCVDHRRSHILVSEELLDTLGQPTLDLIQTVLSSEYIGVRKVFTHLDQPAIVVAEYLSQSQK